MSTQDTSHSDQKKVASRGARIALRLRNDLWILAVVLIALAGWLIRARQPPVRSPLSRRIARVEMNGLPLDEAIFRLGTLSGVHVEVDRAGLNAAGISLAAPVYLHLRDIPLRSAFASLHLGENIAVVERNQAVYVTISAKTPIVVRTYDIGLLINRWLSTLDGMRPMTNGSLPFYSPNDGSSTTDRPALVWQLVVMIDASVRCSFPDDSLPPEFVTSILDKQIEVTGPESVQHAVSDFLRQALAAIPLPESPSADGG